MIIPFHPCVRITSIALLVLISGVLFQPADCQARDGDDWVLVDRFNAQDKLAKSGDADAMYEVGRMYELGRGTEQDLNKAVQWYEKAISKGQNDARAHLGVLYFEGAGVNRDLKRAVNLIEPAAEKGNPTAQYYLGSMYEQGVGMHRDTNQAILWYKKAASSGHYLAVARLKALEGQVSTSQLVEDTPQKPTTRSNLPPRRPKATQIDTPAQVLQQAILDAKWERRGQPATFLPSTNSKCNASKAQIRCQSGEEDRNTGDAIITFVTEATLSGFNNSDQFSVSYSNNVHKVKAVARPSVDGDPPATKVTPNIKLGPQSVVHKLRCELQSVDTLFCVKDNNVSLTYTRVK